MSIGVTFYQIQRSKPLTNLKAFEPDTAALSDDRGRRASSPLAIPWLGWKDVFWRTYQQIQNDRLLAIAAGVVFYGLLALFPAITALVSSYGLFADPSTISDNLESLSSMLPRGSFAIVEDQVVRVLSKETTTLGTTFVVGLLVAIWSANAGVKAITSTLSTLFIRNGKNAAS